MFIHSLVLYVKKIRECGHQLTFSVRPYVFRKLLRMISLRKFFFVRKETHLQREEKEEKILRNHV